MAKISAWAAAASFSASDKLAGLVGGADKTVTRGKLLTALTGEFLDVLGAASYLSLTPGGDVKLVGQTTAIMQLLSFSGAEFRITSAGEIQLNPASGQVVKYAYTPGNAGDWSGSPTDLAIAVDRIAAVVSGGGATPIP
jgi:hypothetical protein